MISVCIATHNGEKYIKKQLDSILCQLSPEDEVVISDDGSTDSTINIIDEYKDNRIKVFLFEQPSKTHHTHIYVSRNFENALKYAKGDYIFLSDQDDIWMPNKVKSCCRLLKDHDIVIHNLALIDEDGCPLNVNIYKDHIKKQNLFMLGGIYYGCSIAFRAKWLGLILPFPKDLLLHDFWISYLIEKCGTPCYHIDSLMWYRYRNDSVSHNVKNSIFFKIKYRTKIICQIISRLIRNSRKIGLKI